MRRDDDSSLGPSGYHANVGSSRESGTTSLLADIVAFSDDTLNTFQGFLKVRIRCFRTENLPTVDIRRHLAFGLCL
jgi:hypothetical protein